MPNNLTPAERVAAEMARIAGNVADAYTACDAKGATMPTAADQDSDHLAATINTITGGGPAPAPSVEKDVNFYDYDGTLLHSYTKAEAAALNSLPSLPSHTGLVAQEWNYTLAAVKAAAAAGYGVNVGVSYDTADGATKLYLKAEAHATFPALSLLLVLTAQATVTVYWGDGTSSVLENTSSSTSNVTASHSYQEFTQAAEVCISISGDNFYLGRSYSSGNLFNNTRRPLKKVNIGSNCIGILSSAFRECFGLTSVTIPNSVTSIGYSAFQNCSSLTSVTIPNSVTSIGYSAFQNCSSLTSVTIPNSVTSISSGVFGSCNSLTSVTIPPSVTTIGDSAFQNCYSLTSVTISNNVTAIGELTFQSCNSLTSVTISNNVTAIGDYVFNGCSSLTSITIPNSVTAIGNSTFANSVNIQTVDLSRYTDPAQIPTVKTNSFTGTTCIFLVANSAMFAAFQAATNWSSISSDRWEALS